MSQVRKERQTSWLPAQGHDRACTARSAWQTPCTTNLGATTRAKRHGRIHPSYASDRRALPMSASPRQVWRCPGAVVDPALEAASQRPERRSPNVRCAAQSDGGRHRRGLAFAVRPVTHAAPVDGRKRCRVRQGDAWTRIGSGSLALPALSIHSAPSANAVAARSSCRRDNSMRLRTTDTSQKLHLVLCYRTRNRAAFACRCGGVTRPSIWGL
jgi:hypothetical protein